MKLDNKTVAERLEQAAHTMKRMPRQRVQGYGSSWPAFVRDGNEAYGYNQASARMGPPTSQHISEMEEAIKWLMWLECDIAKIVWLRANLVRWKRIAPLFNYSVRTAQNLWSSGIILISHTITNNPLSTSYPYKKLLCK